MRTGGHPGRQTLRLGLLVPGAAYQPLPARDGAPNGRGVLCTEDALPRSLMPASARTCAGGKGKQGPAIPAGLFPEQSVQGGTGKAGQRPAPNAAGPALHGHPGSRSHARAAPTAHSPAGSPAGTAGQALGSAAGAALTILPQRLLCRFISARAS